MDVHPGAGTAREAFDAVAPRYDVLCKSENPLVELIRERVYRSFTRHFAPGATLLELGCGTGEDTLALSERGYRIVATDVAPRMIEQARAKLAAAGRGEATRFILRGAAALADDWATLGADVAGAVDGVFSNLAPLNCELSLVPVRRLLEQALRPGGRFVAVVLPRVCPLEIALFLARGDPRTALRRFKRDPVADVEGVQFPMRYYGAGDFDRALGPGFRRLETRSLGLLLPPLRFGPAFARVPGLLEALARTEDLVSDLPGLRRMGDHILLAYERL
jgi:SAM-dependent methyltransferase